MDRLDLRRLIRRILLSVFLLALLACVGGFYLMLHDRAVRQAEQEARVMLASAVAVGDYTVSHILPKLARLPDGQFHEEMVPFFAAQAVFNAVSGKARLYTYRTPALNPTSLNNLPAPFDVEVMRRFREDSTLTELTGVRSTDREQLFYLARPVRVDSEECLRCHSTPERAPPAMLARYGPHNGFGWTLGETVGMQMLTVPMTEPLRGTLQLVGILAGGLLLVFAIAYFTLSVSLDAAVVRPLEALTRSADAASLSASLELPPLPRSGIREIQRLSEAIGRLRVSLDKALSELGHSNGGGRGDGA
jgi:HAMP domain-containing protein